MDAHDGPPRREDRGSSTRGIEWDDADLADKAYLNAAELAKHKPQDANGNACGGTGALAGFDCNGDGVFSVSDYAADARVAAVATDPTDVCYPGADTTHPGRRAASAT